MRRRFDLDLFAESLFGKHRAVRHANLRAGRDGLYPPEQRQ